MTNGNLHALLIGIDCYLPNELPGGGKYESLSGSVRDIQRVEQFLSSEIDRPPERILKLTASRGPEGLPIEPRDCWPTYENMVAKFHELTAGAAPGDQVYVHYSGHGGRVTTLFPKVKGKEGFDEGLVPCNIGDPQARYLRGAEVSKLIQEMVAKQLLVTLVFDCCHSGGASRGPKGAVKRGLGITDRTPRPTASLVGTLEELLALQRTPAAQGPATRSLSLQATWLPNPQGYVLLAACRPQEFAFEYPFNGEESQGALTYWLLDSLRQGGTGLTYKQLHERVFAKVHSFFSTQTPLLVGEADRVFFGAGKVEATEAVSVLDTEGSRVLLNVGQMQGVRKGMQFAIYDSAADMARGRRHAVVEIADIGATASWARVLETVRSAIEQGSQAIPLSLGSGQETRRLKGVVRAVGGGGPSGEAVERIRKSIADDPGGFLRLAAEGETADVQVVVNGQNEYELQDKDGKPIPNLRPPIAIDKADATAELMRRLVHLSRYRNVLKLNNADDQSPLKQALGLRVLGTQLDFEPGDEPDPRPPQNPSSFDLQVGEWVFLEIANRSSRILNFVVLDLQPDWGISQIFPGRNDSAFWPLDPNTTKVVRLRGDLPKGYQEGTDVIKIFASMGAPSFRWMLLPPLDQPDAARRTMTYSAYASEEWTTEHVEVRLRR